MTYKLLLVFCVPYSHCPIIGTGQEDWAIIFMPEGTASNFVDWTCMTEIGVEILLRVRHGASVNGAILSGDEIINVGLRILGEVNRQTSCINESHATTLLFCVGTRIYIFLVESCLPLELHQLSELKTFLHRPLNDATISRD